MQKILVAVDGSDASDSAVAVAVELATALAARLLVIHVVHDSTLVPVPMGVMAQVEGAYITAREVMESAAAELTGTAAGLAERSGVTAVEQLIRFGPPARTIVDTADAEEVDLIVMGRRGLSDFSGLILGSVTHKVGHLAAQPVMTVP